MRFFLSLIFFIYGMAVNAQVAKQGRLHIYYFKGDKLPRSSKVYLKDDMKSHFKIEKIFSGFLELEREVGSVFISTSRKGPFYEVRIFEGESSQISFDLEKENKFLSKYDSFSTEMNFKNKETKIIRGKVLSRESGQPIKEASVILAGSNSMTKTDVHGNYKIKVPIEQSYSLSVIHSNFRTEIKEIKAGASPSNFKLRPLMGELSEYVVMAPKTKGSVEDLLRERRKSTSVSVSIGSEQFKKNGDSNAAAALKRVSGLSLVEGKYVYIRGLGERYSSTNLNGSMLPSPNPSRRVVPLDMFPTALIESVLIQKSYSVDKPAQFSAGVVEVRTLSIPKKKAYFKLSLSSGASSDKILKGDEKSLVYNGGGGSDLFGKDDGARSLPRAILDIRSKKTEIIAVNQDDCDFFGICEGLSAEDISKLGASFSNNYNTEEEETMLNKGLSFETGFSRKLGALKAGLIAKGIYSNTNDRDFQENIGYQLGENSKQEIERTVSVDNSSSNYNTGGLISAGLELFKRSKIEALILNTRSTTNGVKFITQDVPGNDEDSLLTTRLLWEERELNSLQFKGEHHLFENYKGPKLEWFHTTSESSQERPDNRQYSYDLRSGEFIVRNSGNERQFASLLDKASDLSLKVSGKIKPFSWLSFNASAGGRSFKKNREYSMQRFSFIRQNLGNEVDLTSEMEDILASENIESGEFVIRDSTTSTDNYRADEDNNSVFGSLVAKIQFKKDSELEVVTGVRYEKHNQSVRAFNIIDGKNFDDESVLNQNDHFYNYGLVYSFNKKIKMRSGYSETVVRPDLQEFAPVAYINDDENILEEGNPDLKIASVKNFDLRFDFNFNAREFFSIGAFRKDILNPIETVSSPTPGDAQTFKNVSRALNDGVEFEFRKYLHAGFTLGGNYSLISSKVKISEEDRGTNTSLNRPLQGQSPYLVNLTLGYELKKAKLSSALVYNMSGRRIAQIGDSGLPDIYEESFQQLDFTLNKKISKNLSINFKAQNLLNPSAQRTQGSLPVRSFKYGRRYSLSLSTSI